MTRRLLLMSVVLWMACGQKSGPSGKEDSLYQAPKGSLCFMRASGRDNRDTTIVNLVIDGKIVNGEMTDQIQEKDRRRGNIKGAIDNNKIEAVFVYMQEGIMDSLEVEFKLTGDALLQKPLTYNKTTGRQLTDTAANYEIKLNKIACGADTH
jgi:hypothetical protein